jgi:putative addiction module component (TIGR02574 family)
MNERVRLLSEEAAKLTPEERLELVERINLTLLDRQEEIDGAWDKEVERRMEAYRRGEMKSYTWEEIKAARTHREHSVSE